MGKKLEIVVGKQPGPITRVIAKIHEIRHRLPQTKRQSLSSPHQTGMLILKDRSGKESSSPWYR